MTIRHVLCLGLLLIPLAAAAQEPPRLVKLTQVTAGQETTDRIFFGRVVARQTVDLAFQVGGQIVKLPVVEGQPVRQGEMVAQLELDTFERNLEQARLQKEQSDRTVARLEQLSRDTVSQVTFDDAETEAQLSRIAVENAQTALEHATLTAPFDALVAARDVANFTTIAAGTPVVRLHDMSDLRIDIDVPELLFQRASNRSDEIVVTAEFPSIDRVFPVEFREFNAETSTIGQTFRITLGFVPPDDFAILPGSSATVTARLPNPEPHMTVPIAAVATDPAGDSYVMRFVPPGADSGTVEKVAVKLEPGSDGEVVVTSGLSAGDEIVAAGAARLEDGQSVRRFSGFGG